MRVRHVAVAALAALAFMGPERAEACGGCFAPAPVGNEVPPIVTAHRMVLSISTDQTVLWDQIRYAGAPSEFAWVLPVKPGARVELGSDAWFDVLDAATNPIVIPPEDPCGTSTDGSGSCSIAVGSSMGCGDTGSEGGDGFDLGPSEGVDIVSHGSAGPYETVVLSSEDPKALTNWLEEHEYAIAEDIQPVIEQYVTEGFDFVALRLAPGAGIQQMRPVRVVQPGAVPVLPLRMVAAGAGARTAISLFVIAEGRYTPDNFEEANVDRKSLRYDYATGLSNYGELRDAIFERNAQQTFLVPYSMQGTLFKTMDHPVTDLPVVYRTTGSTSGYVKMADAYVQQAYNNGETSSTTCAQRFTGLENDKRRIVDPCDADEPDSCHGVDPTTEIDRRELFCDAPIGSNVPLDDLAVALTGQHPADVWITRLDANLGKSAFGRDLSLAPHPSQVQRSGFTTAGLLDNPPCGTATMSTVAGPSPRTSARLAMATGLAMALACALGRRVARIAKNAAKGGAR
ncbi:MAG: DUF2330 domain-containing protein [Polyangiaceae bacterium]|nr:DUF2330 domain-containing protein [Polyangiaceae bacterium]